MTKNNFKIPSSGERIFIVREIGLYHRKLWLEQSFIAEIRLSPSLYPNLTEEIWKKILSVYEVNGIKCEDYVIERNFNDSNELWNYLKNGGRITNLDESCRCYVKLVDGVLRFDTGDLISTDDVLNSAKSWHPFYPSPKMIEDENKKLIHGMLNPRSLD